MDHKQWSIPVYNRAHNLRYKIEPLVRIDVSCNLPRRVRSGRYGSVRYVLRVPVQMGTNIETQQEDI